MKKFIEKLIGRLEEQAEQYRRRGFEHEEKGYSTMADKYYAKKCSYLHSIEIVNQLAEEYQDKEVLDMAQVSADYAKAGLEELKRISNNGWIPVSERLPKIGTLVLATTESGNVCDDVLIYDYECSTSKEPCFHMWDDEMWNCYTPRVIAWQPLPAPYQPKGE